MRVPVLVIALLLLAGCAARNVAFEKESGGPEIFARDDAACAAAALLGLPTTAVSYDRNRRFNQLYGDCMIARGHEAGPYARNPPASPPPTASASGNS